MKNATANQMMQGALPDQNLQRRSYGIRARLYMGFALIGIVLLAAIVIIIFRVSTSEKFAKKVVDVRLPALEWSYDFSHNLDEVQLSLYRWVYLKDPAAKIRYTNAVDNLKKLEEKTTQLSELFITENEQNALKKITGLTEKFLNESVGVINAETAEKASLLIKSSVDPALSQLFDLLEGALNINGQRNGGLFDMQHNELLKGTEAIIGDLRSIKIVEYILFLAALLLFPLAAFQTMRGVLTYVNVFRLHSNRVARGDLTQRVEISSADEMGQLGHDLNVMTDNLSSITAQITAACHNMATSLEEVRHSVDVQSSGATEQASSINQITSSLEEIDKSSSQTIEKAQALGEVAERTREKGQLGLEAVEKSVEGMKSVRDKVQIIAETILELSTQTQQVGEITAVVNRLAQQSKMLALNASIEAAKAGEAGKGFAVVASEVKNLAEQSEQSTTQVQKILENIRQATEKAVMATEEGTKGVDYGTGLVEQTGDIVRNLSSVIHETTIATQQIEAAIRQENVGIEQITAGMNEINQVTSSFVDSVKQTTEAMGNLGQMVSNLKKNIDVYKV